MPSWNDLGAAFSTLREIDVAAIREESERPLTIACLGERSLVDQALYLLRATGSRRYGPIGIDPLADGPLSIEQIDETTRRADLLLILIDGRRSIPNSAAVALGQLADLALPTTIVICNAETPPIPAGETRRSFANAYVVTIPDLSAPVAGDTLAMAILERLPGELHLAAARRLPGLRPVVSRQLINQVAFTNASYALASALPEQIPFFSIPFATADILVLTKNQAMLVYKLALANGAPPEFQSRIREVLPVIGGAFIWRQIARSLIGLIPFWGIVPKVAIAYAGTYTTGVAAGRWFSDGELVSGERLKEISQEAMRMGRERAASLVASARERGFQSQGLLQRAGERVRRVLPGRRKPGTQISSPENGQQES